MQHTRTYGPATNGSYDGTNPGLASFDLPHVYWDEIRFIGDNANVADATDFLVESISGLPDRPELGGDTATGSGTKIPVKGGNWFMYNNYTAATSAESRLLRRSGRKPQGRRNIVGQYCIVKNPDGSYTANYTINPTITIGGFVYDIVVLDTHLSIKDSASSFTGSPGTDDNADFNVSFTDPDGVFKVFAHFSLDYV